MRHSDRGSSYLVLSLALAFLAATTAVAGDLAPQGQAEAFIGVIPVVGSTPGQGGSYFKTAVQLYNPNSTAYSGRVVFHPGGASGQAGDPSFNITVPAQSMLYYADFLPAIGVATGLGSLDVYVPFNETRPFVANSRVYNDGGASGTTGFSESFEDLDSFATAGDKVYLVCSPDPALFRLNVGVRTLSHGATLVATLRSANGTYITSINKSYPATFYQQVSVDSFLEGLATVHGNESLTFQILTGEVLVYGATVDNRTQDPSLAVAHVQ